MLEQANATTTLVSFLLDRTGSMEAIKSETISGFNAYLDALERDAGDVAALTMLQFDSQGIDTLYKGARLADVRRLTPETYQPRAYTPLIDACMATIKATEETIVQRRDKPKVIVVFQTDGGENASRKHKVDELRDLIERRKAEGWNFVFLGADIDAYSTARSFGIDDGATVAYRGKQSLGMLQEAAAVFGDFAHGRSQRVQFSDEQKRAAGDGHTTVGNAEADSDEINEALQASLRDTVQRVLREMRRRLPETDSMFDDGEPFGRDGEA